MTRTNHRIEILPVKVKQPDLALRLHPNDRATGKLGAEGLAFRMRENHERLHAATASEERGEGVTLFEGQIDRARPEGASTVDRALWDRKHIALAEDDLAVLKLDHKLAVYD